jgi:phage replication O-like protein O
MESPKVRMERELRRHHLSEREHLVSDALNMVSLGFGLEPVKIPKLETISEITGLPRQHVQTAVKSLTEMRIISMRTVEGGVIYTLNQNSDTWKAKPRVALATIQRGMDLIRELNGLADAG